MEKFARIFGQQRPQIIGMIHVQALPGTPRCQMSVEKIADKACLEAEIYKKCNVDAILLENMHDVPYLHTESVGPEISAAMAVVCAKVRQVFLHGPVGIQVLSGANHTALAVAKAAGLDFIRAEGFVYSHVGNVGLINGCAGNLLRYRKNISAEDIQIFTDIKKKHSAHMLTDDVHITQMAKDAEFFGSDGVIVTGKSTGLETSIEELKGVKSAVQVPVLVGSGVTLDNVRMYSGADALIIGSHFKIAGQWQNDVDSDKVGQFMKAVQDIR